MKIRIYAILPETPEDVYEPVSGELEINTSDGLATHYVAKHVQAVCNLYPDWIELNIERITTPD